MLSEISFRKIVRASAWYDLVVTAPLATPWSLVWFLSAFQRLHETFGLSGAVPVYDTGLALFANLLGSVVVVWALVRIHSPLSWLGRFDAAARVMFSIWMLYAVAHGASVALLGFLAVELCWGAAQLLPIRSDI